MSIDLIHKQLARVGAILVFLSHAPTDEVAKKLPEVREHLDDLQIEVDRLRDIDTQTEGQT